MWIILHTRSSDSNVSFSPALSFPLILAFHVCVCMCVSCLVVSDPVTLWTVACQAPLSMGFSRQEYWSGLPFPFPGDLPHPRTEPRDGAQVSCIVGRFFIIQATKEAQVHPVPKSVRRSLISRAYRSPWPGTYFILA